MSSNGSDREREFFVTGAETYLDADDAMAQFRHMVQDKIATLVSGRLEEINRACDMAWTTNDLKDYTSRQSDNFLVGKQVTVESPSGLYCGGLYFYLRIGREGGALAYTTMVDLYRLRANIAKDLWKCGAASGTASWKGTDLWFQQKVPSSDETPDFPEHLNRALDDFIKFIGDCGGIRKHLPAEPPASDNR
jgi:hypothetical protein